jgi:hypothetical protein
MDIYSKLTPLVTNATVKCKGIFVDCTNPSGPTHLDLYTYGATFAGQTSAQRIHIPAISTQVIPIQVAGVSFSSAFLSVWGLN